MLFRRGEKGEEKGKGRAGGRGGEWGKGGEEGGWKVERVEEGDWSQELLNSLGSEPLLSHLS